MNIFKSKQRPIVFITINCGSQELLDYPEYLPLPRIGEYLLFKNISGRVQDITHIIEANVAEIKITVIHC